MVLGKVLGEVLEGTCQVPFYDMVTIHLSFFYLYVHMLNFDSYTINDVILLPCSVNGMHQPFNSRPISLKTMYLQLVEIVFIVYPYANKLLVIKI